MSKAKYYVMLALVCMVWGATPVTGKLLVDAFSPLLLTGIRFAVIVVILFMWLALTRQTRQLRLTKELFYLMAALGCLGVLLHNGLLFWGLHFTTATNTALIESLGPTITTILAFIFLGERLNRLGFMGIFISCAGALFIITRGDIGVLTGLDFNVGDLIILGCEAAWSAYIIVAWRVKNRLSTIGVTAWSGLFGALMCFAAGWATDSLWVGTVDGGAMASFIYIVFASGLFAFVAWNWSANAVGASKAGVFVYLVPLTGAFLGVFALGEELAPAQLVGALLIVGGVLVTVKSKVLLRNDRDSRAEEQRSYGALADTIKEE